MVIERHIDAEKRRGRPGCIWPSYLLQEQRMMRHALLPKGLAELVFLLF